MTGVEVIAAALAAGATAGVTGAASSAIEDAYTGLRDLLRRRLGGRGQDINTRETDARVWEADLGPDLVRAGADTDAQILAAARLLLEVTGMHSGGQLRIENNYGAAAASMTGPVTINNSREVLPPTSPGAA